MRKGVNDNKLCKKKIIHQKNEFYFLFPYVKYVMQIIDYGIFTCNVTQEKNIITMIIPNFEDNYTLQRLQLYCHKDSSGKYVLNPEIIHCPYKVLDIQLPSTNNELLIIFELPNNEDLKKAISRLYYYF